MEGKNPNKGPQRTPFSSYALMASLFLSPPITPFLSLKSYRRGSDDTLSCARPAATFTGCFTCAQERVFGFDLTKKIEKIKQK